MKAGPIDAQVDNNATSVGLIRIAETINTPEKK